MFYFFLLKDLCKNFKFIRKTRGDGNCFFRAFGFSYLETLIGQKEQVEKYIQIKLENLNFKKLNFNLHLKP